MTYPWPADSQALQIDDLLVDLRYRRIVTVDGSVELQQRVFDLLLFLVAEPNKLFARGELFDSLWSGLVVDDANLSQSIWLLRKALGESRRDWIRTVAKRGYVFHPPGAVQWFAAMPTFGEDGSVVHPGAAVVPALLPPSAPVLVTDAEESEAGSVNAGVSAPASDLGAVPPKPRRSALRRWVALALLTAAGIATLLWLIPPRVPALMPVALISVQAETGNDVPWATTLLNQWLGWKLSQLPEVRMLSSEELASGTDIERPMVAMLSATRTADGKHVTIRARVQRNGRETVLEENVGMADVPAAVDRLSAQVMAQLLPDRDDQWPSLVVDAASAQQYLPVGAAFERGDWQAVAQLAPGVLTGAPRFGLMHLQLALAQAHLGESAQAIRQLEIASRLLTPMPEEGRASLAALKLEVDPRQTRGAERALHALVDAHPSYTPYRERYIRALLETGKYNNALTEVEREAGAGADTTTRRILRELQYADLYYALGQPQRSQRHALAAQQLADGGGDALRNQRAEAALAEARALSSIPGGDVVAAYRRASGLLLQAGSRSRAEYADILADVHASQVGNGNGSDALTAALERARQAGAPGLEADILVTLANVSQSPEARLGWLEQALQTAQGMGNLNLQGEIEAELAIDDLVHLRLPQARARATHLQALGLEGLAGSRINSVLSRVYELEGRVGEALAASQLALQALPNEAGSPGDARAGAACAVMRIGAYTGNLPPDAAVAQVCRQAQDRFTRLDAAWAELNVALLQRQPDIAGARLKTLLDLLQGDPAISDSPTAEAGAADRLRVAPLALRGGDPALAARLAGEVRAGAPTAPLLPIQRVLLQVLEAEIDAARGNWSGSRERAEAARAQLPAGAWELVDRLDLLKIADDLRTGRTALAVALAKTVHARAGRHQDLRTQQRVLSLVPASELGLDADATKAALAGREKLPGATMAWLNLDVVKRSAADKK